MPIRSRSPQPDPARRFRAIFGEPAATGWVPGAPAAGNAAERSRPVALHPAEIDRAASDEQGPGATDDQERQVPPPVVDAGSQPQSASVVALLRAGRLDPGRRGAVALGLVGLAAAGVAGVLLLRSRPTEQPLAVPGAVRTAGATPADHGGEVVVAVAGKIRHPGLVRLPAGSRVDDAVRAAGGVAPGASTGLVNLARKLIVGEQVLIGVAPPPSAFAGTGPSPSTGAGGAAPIDLNAAAAGDLDHLPGIGPVLAERIVSWRTEHGRFASVDQLRQVSGIGESKYQQLKARVRV